VIAADSHHHETINSMKSKLPILCLILALGGLVHAADLKPDPTGTWKWVAPANPDGQIPKITFTLKLQGEILTGTIARSSGTKTITNGVFKGDRVSFQVLSEGHAGKSTTTYTGTLSGDTIKGKLEIHVLANDRTLTSDWVVKRESARPQP
jgi:hypothetical protein